MMKARPRKKFRATFRNSRPPPDLLRVSDVCAALRISPFKCSLLRRRGALLTVDIREPKRLKPVLRITGASYLRFLKSLPTARPAAKGKR